MGKSRKTRTKTKKRGTSAKEQTREREKPRREAVERIPSNAPTMAIAPSDYEHIFHEGPAGSAAVTADGPPPGTSPGNGNGIRTFPVSPPAAPPPPPPQLQPLPAPAPQPPPPPPMHPNSMSTPFRELSPTDRAATRTRVDNDGYSSPTNRQANNYSTDLQVSPDGYTLLGQQPPELTGGRRIALPAHIVRAGNQFSRAALVRVARYLASRSDFR